MPKILLTFVFLLATIAAPRMGAAADPGDIVSTKQWIAWCTGGEPQQLACRTYLSGFIHAITLHNDILANMHNSEPVICIPTI